MLQKLITWSERTIPFSFYVLIFFLPISIAFVESFFGVILFCFFLKRGAIFYQDFKDSSSKSIKWTFRERLRRFIKCFKPVDNDLNLPMGFFILVNFLSVLMSQAIAVSIKGFFFKLLEQTYLYFIFIEVFKTRQQIKIFLIVFLVSATVTVMNGMVQWFSGADFIYGHHLSGGRISSTLRHSNDFGSYLLFACLLLVSLLLYNIFFVKQETGSAQKAGLFQFANFRWHILHVLCLIVFISALGLTLSRGAWLGFFAGVLFLATMFRKREILFVCLFVIFLFVLIFSPDMVKERNLSILKKGLYENTSGRIEFWQESRNIISDFPVLGVGLNAYSQVAPKYKISWGGYPHNCYLQMAAETGLAGLFAFLWILFAFFIVGLRNFTTVNDKFLQGALMGLLAGVFAFLIQSSVDTNLYSLQLGNLLWVMMGASIAIQKVT